MKSKLFQALATTGLAGVFAMTVGGCAYQTQEGTTTIETSGGSIDEVNNAGWHVRVPVINDQVDYDTGRIFEVPMEKLNIYYSPDEAVAQKAVEAPVEQTKADVDAAKKAKSDEIAKQNAQQYTIHSAVIRATINPTVVDPVSKDPAVVAFHKKYQSMDAIRRLVWDRGTEAYKSVVRKIDPLKINAHRDDVGPSTKDILQARLDAETGIPGGIQVDSVIFVNFHFEQGVENAFEKANEARASVQAEQYALEKESIKVETAAKQGQAKAAAEVAEAEGRAQAIEKEGQALKKFPEVITLRGLQAWEAGGSKVPDTWVTSGSDSNGNGSVVPFIPIGKYAKPPTPGQ